MPGSRPLLRGGVCGGGLFTDAKPAGIGRSVLAGQREVFGNIGGGIKPGRCRANVCAASQGKGEKAARECFEHDAYDIAAKWAGR